MFWTGQFQKKLFYLPTYLPTHPNLTWVAGEARNILTWPYGLFVILKNKVGIFVEN